MRRSVRSAFACAIASIFITCAPFAQVHARSQFDIPAQPLADALRAVGTQSNINILFDPPLAAGHVAPALKAQLTPEEVLVRLLQGTGLKVEFLNDRTAVVVPARSASPATTSEGEVETRSGGGEGQNPPEDSGQPEKLEEIRISVPEILVRGSKILNMDIRRTRDDTQPYVIFDRGAIEQSGAVNVSDFLKQRLPMNTVALTPGQLNDVNGSLSRINLRGLGASQTLILVDGHRTPTVNGAGSLLQSDLNGIPLAAVERIEVLPTTASGIYGGSATGGVINVVLRRDYEGRELKVTYGNTFDGDAAVRQVALNTGFNLEGGKTNILLAGSFSDTNTLLTQDRDLQERGRQTTLVNNPSSLLNSAAPPLGATPNIRSSDGSNLTLRNGTALSSPRTFVPVGYGGAAVDGGAALVANASRYNFDLADSAQASGGRQTLANGPRIESLMATARRTFGARMHAFLELSAANNTGRTFDNLTSGSFTLPASAPTNPFNQAINVRVPVPQADGPREVTHYDRRAVGGLIWQLPHEWQAAADYTWNRSRFAFSQPSALAGTATAAVTSGAVDILRDPAAVDLSPFLNPPSGSTALRSTLKDLTLRLAGGAFTLPAGKAMVSGLLERREDELSEGSLLFFPGPIALVIPQRSQTIESVYLEIKMPLVAAKHGVAGLRELELQLAGRHDDYSVEGTQSSVAPNATITRVTNRRSSTNPTVGLRYVPFSGLMLRASYGKGFLPPAVNQLVPQPIVAQSGASFFATDPRRGHEPLGQFQLRSGGNPDLEPEQSESVSVGAVLEPAFAPGVRLSVDYTRIDKSDNIVGIAGGVQGVLNNESVVPDRVVRGAVPPNDPFNVGRVTLIDTTLVNLAGAQVEAYDAQLDVHYETASWGTLDFFALATWQTHFRTQLLPTVAELENVGITSDFPLKLKGNAGMHWHYRSWTLGWMARYFDAYLAADPRAAPPGSLFDSILLNQGNGGRVPSQIYHDFSASYRLGAGGGTGVTRFVRSAEIKLGINNVFDQRPPFDAFQSPARLYSPYGDARLANYYLSLTTAF